MPSVETKIWMAIRERINSIPLDFDKAWPAEAFATSYAGEKLLPFLRIGSVSVAPVPVFIEHGKRHIRTGTIIITLVHPMGQLSSVYDEHAGQIAQHFRDGTMMDYDGVCVKITAQPHVQPGYEDNGYWQVPISIPWRTFA